MVATSSVLAAPRQPHITVASRPSAIVDSLNVIRAGGRTFPRVEIFLDVALRLVRDGYDVLCISDANTRFELAEYQGQETAQAYESLLARFPAHFTECPGRMQADPFILAEANARDALVVSNDHFNRYLRRFGWIEDPNRFLKVAVVRDHYYLNHLRCRIPTDVAAMIHDRIRA